MGKEDKSEAELRLEKLAEQVQDALDLLHGNRLADSFRGNQFGQQMQAHGGQALAGLGAQQQMQAYAQPPPTLAPVYEPPKPPPPPFKLDLGCGTAKREGYTGVDIRPFKGVDVVADLGNASWPFANDSVDEVWCAQMVEHLTPKERIHFSNELFRVLKPGAKATIVTPHWCSLRAFGDLTHQWPPVSEMWYAHLNSKWRAEQAPHGEGYTCDFDYPPVTAYNVSPTLGGRNQEYVQHALQTQKEAASDLAVTLTKPASKK